MNRLYLVRHGENPANLTHEFSYRRVDYPLTPKGELQARQTAERFRAIRVDAVYTSPLRRAFETAGPIGRAVGLEPVVLEDLRELNVGRLEDGPPTPAAWAEHDEVIRAWRAGDTDARFPGGESLGEFLARARQALAAMLGGREEESVVAVGHGGFFETVVASLCEGSALDGVAGIPNRNCAVSEFRGSAAGGRLELGLVSWADWSHLAG